MVKKIVIVGGGASGWMAAAMITNLLGKGREVTLIESEAIGIIGVGEATIPPIQTFNKALGINEATFMEKTRATFKMGIQFQDWGGLGESYMHTFDTMGQNIGMTSFYHYWLKAKKEGHSSDFWDFSLNYQACLKNKFNKMETIGGTSMPGTVYAYHFDAILYAGYLREISEKIGVTRIEGKVVKANLRQTDGFIESLAMENGDIIEGDLFIDCSGFAAVLIDKVLKTDFIDWSHWCPVNRAIAVPSEPQSDAPPYTHSRAHQAGWQWRIPLQHRTGNGHVYSSEHISDDEAHAVLLNNIEGELLAEPRLLKFTVGKREKLWNKNCVAIGLAGGFIEPLESTALHLVQSGIIRLIKMFPAEKFYQADIDEYNNQASIDFERIRDFIILHYCVTRRKDSAFWRMFQAMEIPETLRHKIALFKSQGRIFRHQDELFSEDSWLQVMLGQGLFPQSIHPITDQVPKEEIEKLLADLSAFISNSAEKMPSHDAFIKEYCQAQSIG